MQLSKRQLAYLLQQQFNAPTLDQYIKSLGPAAWFRMDQGVTVTGAGISQVDDLSGNARHLLDPGTTRPIYLPYSGTKYLYLPGVVSNYASTPDSVANSITGDIDIRVRVALDDWTPSANMVLASKYVTVGNYAFIFRVSATSGLIQLLWAADGTTLITKNSTVAPTIADGAALWIRVTLDVDNGSAQNEVKFYTAPDSATEPSSWTQLGSTVVTAGTTAIFDSTSALEIGSRNGGGTEPLAGKIYRAIIKNGIDGTTVVDFNPADADGDGDTSFASSTTGETWTINSSGGLPAQIVGRASALFNGTSHYLKCNAFTLNQPTCVLFVGKQVSWTAGEYFFDGNSVNTGALAQQSASTSPRIQLFAGAAGVINNANLAVGSVGVVSSLFNGGNSLLQVNKTAATTGNAGSANMGGFTLGAAGSNIALSNIQVYETVIFPIAPSTAQLDRLVAGLMARHGLT